MKALRNKLHSWNKTSKTNLLENVVCWLNTKLYVMQVVCWVGDSLEGNSDSL